SSERMSTANESEQRPRKRSSGSSTAFEAKYTEGVMLGEGGFGSVYAGYRKDDNLPDMTLLRWKKMGNGILIPMEVALLLKLRPAAAETSAAVTLLDWYDLDDELILVLERPDPCMDLVDYMNSRGSALPEQEAKIIVKQLVDALIEIHSRGVFHRDIKMDNILIEIGNDVPRVRLIDFGCGTYLSEGIYIKEQGTYIYGSPEWFLNGLYRAGPTTVWQLGVVLYGILHRALPFQNSTEIIYENPPIRDGLSLGKSQNIQ
uniref:non-specific serine/threonine protein kinase n=1 Tax=Dicentrarchus labrax TaxID=13489 RepID=A0A8C4D833_DICLA